MSEITIGGVPVTLSTGGGGSSGITLPPGWSGFRVDADGYIRVEDDQQQTYEVAMTLVTPPPSGNATWTISFDTGW